MAVRARLAVPVLAAVLAAGCSTESAFNKYVPNIITPYRMDIQQGNFVTSDMVEKLQPGLSREQVRFILGTPLVADTFHANRWDYVFRSAKGWNEPEKHLLTVYFNEGDQKLARWDAVDVPPPKSTQPPPPERGWFGGLFASGTKADPATAAAKPGGVVTAAAPAADAAPAATPATPPAPPADATPPAGTTLSSPAESKAPEKQPSTFRRLFGWLPGVSTEDAAASAARAASPDNVPTPKPSIATPPPPPPPAEPAVVPPPAPAGAVSPPAASEPAPAAPEPVAPVPTAAPTPAPAPAATVTPVPAPDPAPAPVAPAAPLPPLVVLPPAEVSVPKAPEPEPPPPPLATPPRIAEAAPVKPAAAPEPPPAPVAAPAPEPKPAERVVIAAAPPSASAAATPAPAPAPVVTPPPAPEPPPAPAAPPPPEPPKPEPAPAPAAPAVVPMPAAPAVAQPAATPEGVIAAIERWRAAWQGKDVTRYLAAYAPDFHPANNLTRAKWEAQRRERLSKPSFIIVKVRDVQVTLGKEDAAVAVFVQEYESNLLKETGRKTLKMSRRGGDWLITEEISK